MRSEVEIAFNEISELRSLSRDVVLEALESALVSAYRRDVGASAAQAVEVNVDPNTGRVRIYVEKEVVEDVQSHNTEVDLEKARYFDPEADLGDMVMVQVEGTTKKFGRIAAQTAKQVILQKIREAERNALFEEYADREGDLITATVQNVNAAMITVSLGRTEAMMPRNQQIPGERYKPHDKLRAYVLEVKKSNRGPQIVISRSHRNMLRRLLEYEVPEIFNGQVEIKNIAREPGQRSKVAVTALQEGIDPVGACVGMRGIRIQNIVKELHDEKIDVIEWNSDHEVFIAKALSPARVSGVYLDDDPDAGRTAVVLVPDDQLSLAIGREGQNARLAAKLTGWRIDIKSVSEAVQNALDKIEQPPLAALAAQVSDMLAEVQRIIEKKLLNKAIMPEEYQVLNKFAAKVEKAWQSEREAARQARLQEINAVKSTLPENAFALPVGLLDLPDDIIEALEPLGNVGEIMLRFLIDEGRLKRLLSNVSGDPLPRVQDALDKIVIPDELPDMAAEPEVEPESEVVQAAESPAMAATSSEVPADVDDEAVILSVFGDEDIVEPKPATARPKPARVAATAPAVADDDEADEADEDLDALLTSGTGSKKKDRKSRKERQQRRQLVFDEEVGEIVAKRRRKGSRRREDWEDYEI
ncbi:MAG: transcription termination/antitermination protein NusA [Anaerolineaceae bacterium]|nr:transcription termination/antitermination protein NusA [Anaerolineaceae bacterium]